jgi:hypothetical protein
MMSKVSVALLHQEYCAMNAIRFDVLRVTVGVFFVSLLLLASAAQATDVIRDGNEPTRAIGINNLDIGGTLYDVDFKFPKEPQLVIRLAPS